jgi:hypothetical protein
LTDHRKPLAGWPAENTLHSTTADTSKLPDLFGTQAHDRGGDHRTIWKIELVCGAVYRVDLNGGTNVESRLLKSKAEPARPGEKIDG